MKKETKKSIQTPGYPESDPKDDIYSNFKEEKELDPEDIRKTKAPNDKSGKKNEKEFRDDMSGSDLDVPGSEADEEEENSGSEDEENNFYSLGGEDHHDLDEDKGSYT